MDNWLNNEADKIHNENVKAGWWDGKTVDSAFCEKLVLIHSELSEALEGFRKRSMDDHLSHRPMVEVEFADVLIRLFDLVGAMRRADPSFDLAGAYYEKQEYNKYRQDHKKENREAVGGKRF